MDYRFRNERRSRTRKPRSRNRDILKGSGPVILRTASREVLVERVRRNDRPRVHPGVSLEKDLTLLWRKFKHLYLLAADIMYRTDQGKTVKQEAAEIVGILVKKKFLS